MKVDSGLLGLVHMYEWPHWEGIMHHTVLAIILYAMYCMVKSPAERRLSNVLLLGIIFSLDAILHHFINRKNGVATSYGL